MNIQDYEPTTVDLDDIPARINQIGVMWKQRFLELPYGKAIMLRYNNRQRAHQVRNTINQSSRYHKIPNIRTRIIHAELAIHGTDGWLLYWWKDNTKEEK